MLLVAVAVVVLAIATPYRVDPQESTADRRDTKQAQSAEKAVNLSMKDFEPFLAKRHQGPLFDPPPPAPPVVVKKETPPPPLKLLATMPEPNGGCAMFSDAAGASLVKSVGDQIVSGGVMVTLVEIANDHVVVRQEDRTITLKLTQ